MQMSMISLIYFSFYIYLLRYPPKDNQIAVLSLCTKIVLHCLLYHNIVIRITILFLMSKTWGRKHNDLKENDKISNSKRLKFVISVNLVLIWQSYNLKVA